MSQPVMDHEAPDPEVTPGDRGRLLYYAAGFTAVPSNAAAVAANADRLLAWLEESPDAEDLKWRMRALGFRDDTARGQCDDATGFLDGAITYYLFTTAGLTGDDPVLNPMQEEASRS